MKGRDDQIAPVQGKADRLRDIDLVERRPERLRPTDSRRRELVGPVDHRGPHSRPRSAQVREVTDELLGRGQGAGLHRLTVEGGADVLGPCSS